MVSIIIPSRTEITNILQLQSYRDFELIPAVGPNLRESRRKAIMQAQGEYILLLDSDQSLAYHTLEKCVRFGEMGFDSVTLTEKSSLPLTWLEKVIAYDKELFHSACDDDPVKGAAEPRFFRASFLKNLDFDKLPPLTFELTFINYYVRKMGAKTHFTKALIYHREPTNLWQSAKKFFRYGYYYLPAYRLNPEIVKGHSKPRRVYFTKKALSNPWLYLGLWIHYFTKGIATLLGVICYKLKH